MGLMSTPSLWDTVGPVKTPYATLAGRFLKAKYLGTPLTANFKVTERCNLTCPMCGIPRFGNQKREMSVPQIRLAAQRLSELSVARVVVTGGEPMLRDDLDAIVDALASRGIVVTLLTNGTLSSRERLRRLVDAGVSALGVSLDTLDAEWEDRFCGLAGTWNKAYEALRDGVELLSTGLVYAMCTATRENVAEVPRLVDFVEREIGAFTVVNPVNLPASQTDVRRLSIYAPELAVAKSETAPVDAAYDELLAMKRAGRPLLVSSKFLALSRDYLKGGSMAWSCDAGTIYFNLSSDGGVAPCNEFPAIINILSDDFLEAIRGEGWRQASADQRDRCPGCVLSCWREMSALVKDRAVLVEQTRTMMRRPKRDPQKATAVGGSR